MADKLSPRKLADDSPVEGVATLCCRTGSAHVTGRPALLGTLGRIKCNVAEGKWECPGILMVNSTDIEDKNDWSIGVEA